MFLQSHRKLFITLFEWLRICLGGFTGNKYGEISTVFWAEYPSLFCLFGLAINMMIYQTKRLLEWIG